MAVATRQLEWRLVKAVREVGGLPYTAAAQEFANSGAARRNGPRWTPSLRACKCQFSMFDPIGTARRSDLV